MTHGLHNKGDKEATRRVPLLILPEIKNVTEPLFVQKEVTNADIAPTVYDILGISDVLFRNKFNSYGTSLLNHMDKHFRKRERLYTIQEGGKIQEDEAMREELYQRLKSMGYVE